MTDLERRIKESFDAIDLPVGLNERTLAAIEAQRAESASEAVQPGEQRPALKVRRDGKGLRRAVVALAACLALAAVGFGGAAWYREPTAYLDVDVNPSIELGVNRLNRVVSVEALNSDAEAVVEGVQLHHKTVDEALGVLVSSSPLADYLHDDAYIEVSVASDNEAQRASLREMGERCVSSLECEGSCQSMSLQERAGKRHAYGEQDGSRRGKGDDVQQGSGEGSGRKGQGVGPGHGQGNGSGHGQGQGAGQGAAHG